MAMDKKMTPGKKAEYIWDYYKWHIIIAVTVIIVLAVSAYKYINKERYDAEIIYAGDFYYTSEYEEAVNSLALLGIDTDGDGEKKLKLDQFCYSGTVSYEYKMTMTVTLQNIIGSGKAKIIWLDEERLSLIAEDMRDYIVPVKEWAPEATTEDGYSVSLKDSRELNLRGIPSDGVYMVLVRPDKKESGEYKNMKQIASALAEKTDGAK